jgi:hypothetical protein
LSAPPNLGFSISKGSFAATAPHPASIYTLAFAAVQAILWLSKSVIPVNLFSIEWNWNWLGDLNAHKTSQIKQLFAQEWRESDCASMHVG